jgi:dihydroneopterin aldolase
MVEESILGGKYVVDISIETNFTRAAETDELIDTIDYVKIKEIVVTEMAVRSKLIEHVGQRITNQFKIEFKGLIESTVRIRKVNPPIQGTVKEVAIVIKSKQ